jgi:hypothetical protein
MTWIDCEEPTQAKYYFESTIGIVIPFKASVFQAVDVIEALYHPFVMDHHDHGCLEIISGRTFIPGSIPAALTITISPALKPFSTSASGNSRPLRRRPMPRSALSEDSIP